MSENFLQKDENSFEIDTINGVVIIPKAEGDSIIIPFANLRLYLDELKNNLYFDLQDSRERIFDILENRVDLTRADIREILIAKGFLSE